MWYGLGGSSLLGSIDEVCLELAREKYSANGGGAREGN